MIMTGRFHSYEGIDIAETTIGVRVMQLMGIKVIKWINIDSYFNQCCRWS